MLSSVDASWLRQSATPYVDLSESEKQSDRDQVDRYWPLIEAFYAEREKEARYMGTTDFMHWILTHDESSFRQERAWFKIKPGLLLKYQAELMESLKRIHTMMGYDPDSTVHQLATQSQEQAAQPEADPVPPDGCSCASFWTVRQKHKKDCALYQLPASREEEK